MANKKSILIYYSLYSVTIRVSWLFSWGIEKLSRGFPKLKPVLSEVFGNREPTTTKIETIDTRKTLKGDFMTKADRGYLIPTLYFGRIRISWLSAGTTRLGFPNAKRLACSYCLGIVVQMWIFLRVSLAAILYS